MKLYLGLFGVPVPSTSTNCIVGLLQYTTRTTPQHLLDHPIIVPHGTSGMTHGTFVVVMGTAQTMRIAARVTAPGGTTCGEIGAGEDEVDSYGIPMKTDNNAIISSISIRAGSHRRIRTDRIRTMEYHRF
jgi:hypothetical protein